MQKQRSLCHLLNGSFWFAGLLDNNLELDLVLPLSEQCDDVQHSKETKETNSKAKKLQIISLTAKFPSTVTELRKRAGLGSVTRRFSYASDKKFIVYNNGNLQSSGLSSF